MSYLRDIICVAKEAGVPFIYTLDGYKHLVDDITLDGLLYDGYNWNPRFNSQDDLNIIKAWRAREELEEIIYMLKSIAT